MMTAWAGAHNQHDANFLTFHHFGDFRRRKTGTVLPDERV